jgi:hypothetical protein
LHVYDTILKRLTQHVQDVAAELWPCIQKKHPMVRPRHFARPRHLAPADQPDIRDGVMGGATRAGRYQGRTLTGAADDAADSGGLEGFWYQLGGQDRGQPPPEIRHAYSQRVQPETGP